MIRILLVDDRTTVRRVLALGLALEPDFCVVGEAGDGQEAVEQAETLHPDVVLMDVAMPRMDGITATGQIRQRSPATAVIVHSLLDDALTQMSAREAGAAAFVSKLAGAAALLEAIRKAAPRAGLAQVGDSEPALGW